MGGLLSYSGITTKVRAMQSKLLSPKQLNEFASLNSVSEAVVYLKNQPAYRDLFADTDETLIHRGQVERLLNIAMYTDFAKIYKFATPKQRKFLNIYLMKYETGIIKKCLCAVLNGNFNIPNKDVLIGFLKHFSLIDTDLLFNAKTTEEILESLKNTVYYDALLKITRALDSSDVTLFDYEMALDICYFSKLWNNIQKVFKGRELKLMTSSWGSKIDMLNIQWIYRSKKYYNLSSADIYALIIPINYKLKRTELKGLIEAEDINAFIALLKTTFYAKHQDSITEVGDSLESMYIKILDSINYSAARKNPYTAAIVNSYLYRKEHEIDKLTTALECIRYGLNSNETIRYVN